jgi:hypothetical protein
MKGKSPNQGSHHALCIVHSLCEQQIIQERGGGENLVRGSATSGRPPEGPQESRTIAPSTTHTSKSTCGELNSSTMPIFLNPLYAFLATACRDSEEEIKMCSQKSASQRRHQESVDVRQLKLIFEQRLGTESTMVSLIRVPLECGVCRHSFSLFTNTTVLERWLSSQS